MSTASFWPSCLEAFQRELTPQQFNTWIRPLRLEHSGDSLLLIAPNRFVLQWVKERFATRIEELATVALGRPPRLALVVAESAGERSQVAAKPVAPVATLDGRRGEQASLNLSFSFASFVAGKANQLARAAGLKGGGHPTPHNSPF